MSFRHKLLGYFLSLLALVLGAALWAVDRVEKRRAEEEVLSDLQTTSQVFQETLASREKQMAASLKLLSGDFAFKQAVATGDPPTVLSAALNHRARIGSDILIVADAEGLVLADTRGQRRGRQRLKGVSVVASALAGASASDIQILDGTPFQLSAAPITAPDVIGVLVAGFRIDDRLAASLKQLTQSEVVFASHGKPFAATLPDAALTGLAPALKSLTPGRPQVLGLGGERFLAAGFAAGPDVTALLMRSWDKALEPSRELAQLLLAIGLCGLAVTVVLGLLIAAGVTARLTQLAQATVKIAKGEYDVSLNFRSRDEIGQLGEAFSNMAKGLVEREKIRSVLRKAVSKEIAEALLAKGQIELGGEEKPITVLFSDIRSFTTISEGLAPKELVSQLNGYFIGMARAIEESHGVIDKYVGDAIMALFGAPLGSPQDAANGVRAALAMVRALETLNAKRAQEGLKPWRNGIGLNTGSAVAGTLGSEDRWSYTVIGDAVNLASRLEGLTKHYGARIVVSDSTRQAAGAGFVYRTLDRVVVKGRTEPVQIFEVLGEGECPAWLGRFEEGLSAYRARKFDEAADFFRGVLKAAPGDEPARMYLERAEAMKGKPASQDFDEPTKMTEK